MNDAVDLSDLAIRVLNTLRGQRGRYTWRHAWSRSARVEQMGASDVMVRRSIRELRNAGYPICVGDGGGYYYATERGDVQALRADLMSRVRAMLDTVKVLDEHIDRHYQQELDLGGDD